MCRSLQNTSGGIFLGSYIVVWDVEYTQEFSVWAYRVLYAFDPRPVAGLLIGGDKTGNERWYQEFVPRADRLYDEHLAQLQRKDDPHG